MTNKLQVLQKSHHLCVEIYHSTNLFPSHELFTLTSQIRRASISVALNITEGQNRGTTKDYVRFLYIARGSLEETRECLLLSKDLNYISEEEYQKLEFLALEISKMLNALIKKLKGELEKQQYPEIPLTPLPLTTYPSSPTPLPP